MFNGVWIVSEGKEKIKNQIKEILGSVGRIKITDENSTDYYVYTKQVKCPRGCCYDTVAFCLTPEEVIAKCNKEGNSENIELN